MILFIIVFKQINFPINLIYLFIYLFFIYLFIFIIKVNAINKMIDIKIIIIDVK